MPTKLPTNVPKSFPTEVPPPIDAPAGGYIAHIVAPGQTLDDLARSGMSADEIMRYNHLHSPTLRAGQPLLIKRQNSAVQSDRVLVERGNPQQPRVAVTLDAGASAAPTPKMLDTLRDHGVHVTFFLTGKWMRENPDLLRRIVAEGHEIANHSVNHPDFTKLEDAAMLRELNQTDELAQQIAGVSTRPFFRPPYGAYNKHVLDVVIGAGYLPIYWTVDSLDSVGQPKSPGFLIDRVTTHLQGAKLNGAIFLMHCGSEPSAEALPTILDRFAAMGVKVTTVSELLGP